MYKLWEKKGTIHNIIKIKNMEQLVKIGQTTMLYYAQQDTEEITNNDFKLWINSLNEPMKSDFNKKGIDKCKSILNFQRFLLESKDLGLEEYLKENLSKEDYLLYKEQGK